MADSDAPIALRRTPRRVTSAKFQASMDSTKGQSSAGTAPPKRSETAVATTPRRRTTGKRVRFSDPGPILRGGAAQIEDESSLSSTGLTPMISRTRLLGTPKSHPKRRHSSASLYSTANSKTESEEITFLPLRQVLDGRVKRRIKRNGLSEEMNTIFAERRTKAKQTKAELNRLRQELEEKDEEIMRLQEETVMVDTDRVVDLERKISRLKRQLSQISGATSSRSQSSPVISSSPPPPGLIRSADDPFSDDSHFVDLDMDPPEHDSDTDEEMFGDSSMAELVCSTPTRKATTVHTSASFRSSFPTPPSTSPSRQLLDIANATDPLTPCSTKTPSFTSAPTTTSSGAQASLPDPELTRLQAEHSDLVTKLSQTLTQLSDKTHALTTLNESLSALGFNPEAPNPDSLDIITTISSTLRSCRLQLEYLSPGELVLPLSGSGSGSKILQTMIAKLKDLTQRNKDCEDAIDEYHTVEQNLREQLSARVDVMDDLREKLQKEQKEKKELEAGMERLKAAVAKYTGDMTELENLIATLETQFESAHGEQQEKIAALEREVTAKTREVGRLKGEIEQLEQGHKTGLAELRRTHGEQLRGKDAKILELRQEVERVSGELKDTAESVVRLKAEIGRVNGVNEGLVEDNRAISRKYEVEKRKAGRIVGELGRVLALARGDADEPDAERDEGLLDGGMAGRVTGRGTKRRRYDSGLGFLDEQGEEEVEDVRGDA
ncbi:hypothetical protein QBC40DRAFT_267676 [Triangularia verruculosa]|uniref:Uncharacterized protein n=1 Tax=Triangularia verruculosa TaxID=2587418 RepID=A0AAN7ASX6_9PEZI|nr:hypothetical protein QBC40DRAFT_267676 [Triangularia verruculosa]